MKANEKRIDWQHWSTIITVAASFIALPIYLGNKMDNNFQYLNQKIDQNMSEIRKENHDFHGRLTACETNVYHIRDDHKEICANLKYN